MYRSVLNRTKNILVVISTHGNEKIGQEVVAILKQRGLDELFDCLVANPKAAKINERFIEKDLNRSYPGARKSLFYRPVAK